MTLQRFADLEVLAAEIATRHRHGTPTLRYFGLGLQGYAAQYQGRADEAARFFTEASRVELPVGTYRVIQTVEARMAFERGDRTRAFELLRDHAEELLDTDYTDVARMVAVEFVTVVGQLGRLADADQLLAYLDTTGDFGRLARTHLVADVVRRIEADPSRVPRDRPPLDAHGALRHVRDVLDELIADGSAA
jgi:hypothetical protein